MSHSPTHIQQEQASAPSVVPVADPDDKQTKLVTKTQLYAESKDRALDAFQAELMARDPIFI